MSSFDMKEKVLIGVTFIISLLYVFTVSQIDCNTITMWGYDLLTSVFDGAVSRFPEYTYEIHTMPNNYSLFDSVITAAFLSPVFLVEHFAGIVINSIIYDIWFKVLILAIHIIDIIIFYNLLDALKFDHAKKVKGIILYMLSAIVCICVVGKGQVDIYTVTFIMLGALCFIKKKYIYMSVFLGLAFLTKPFALLVIVPFYLLSIYKSRERVFLYAIISIIPYVIDYTLTRILMPGYFEMKELNAQIYKEALGSTRVEELFSLQINSVYVFLAVVIVICFIALRKGKNQEVEIKDYLFYPALTYIAYGIFVSPSCNWFITIVPALIIMGLSFRNEEDFELLYFGCNIGVVIYIFFTERFFRPGISYTFLSLLGFKNGSSLIYDSLSSERLIVYGIGATVFLICMLIICVVYYLEKAPNYKPKHNNREVAKWYRKGCFLIQYIPVVAYLIINYMTIGRG